MAITAKVARFFPLLLGLGSAHAQDANQKAIDFITQTADKLCVNVDQTGSKTSAEHAAIIEL